MDKIIFASEEDFQELKKDIADVKNDTATIYIDMSGTVKKARERQSIRTTILQLEQSIIEFWKYHRINYINSKAEFDFLASAPDDIAELEPFIIPHIVHDDFSLVDFYHECYTDEWELKDDCKYFDVIIQAQNRKNNYFAPEFVWPKRMTHYGINTKPWRGLFEENTISNPEDPLTIPYRVQDRQTRNRNGKEIETKPEIVVDAVYTYSKNGLDVFDRLTAAEGDALISAGSLYIAALKQRSKPRFTLQQLYSVTGGGEKITSKQKTELTAALIKLNNVYAHLDVTQQIEYFGVKNNDLLKIILRVEGIRPEDLKKKPFAEHLLNIRYYFDQDHNIESFEILSPPIMLYHAALSNQYFRTDQALYHIHKIDENDKLSPVTLDATTERKAIVSYLLDRIHMLKYDTAKAKAERTKDQKRNKSNPDYKPKDLFVYQTLHDTVSFDTLFDKVGISTTNRGQLKRYKDFCFDCMNYWKHEGFISDYEIKKKRTAFVGIRIIVE